VIFAGTDELEVHAVIDYHKVASTRRGLAEHHAVLSLVHSPEWDLWNAVGRHMHEQRSFARMLDINSDDIAQPEAASLVKAVMDFGMATSATVLPPFFTLSIPVFAGEPKTNVKVLVNGSQDCNTGKISLGLELARKRIIVEMELARIACAITSATSAPLMMGSIKF
jgi:uncharacterized protein YfdQ (DUF2303 family)